MQQGKRRVQSPKVCSLPAAMHKTPLLFVSCDPHSKGSGPYHHLDSQMSGTQKLRPVPTEPPDHPATKWQAQQEQPGHAFHALCFLHDSVHPFPTACISIQLWTHESLGRGCRGRPVEKGIYLTEEDGKRKYKFGKKNIREWDFCSMPITRGNWEVQQKKDCQKSNPGGCDQGTLNVWNVQRMNKIVF